MFKLYAKHNPGLFFWRIFYIVVIIKLFIIAAVPGSAEASALVLKNELTDAHIEVPGTGAYFATPDDLLLSDRFDGFAASGRIAEIIVVVIKSPFLEISAGFTDAALRTRGVEIQSRGELEINGAKAQLIKASHQDGDRKWGKWLMLLEYGNDTLVVNGVFVSGDSDSAKDVETILKSVVVKPGEPLEDFGDDDDIDEDNPDLIEPAASQDVPYIVSDEPYVPPATTTLSGDELFKKVSVDAFEVTAQIVSSDAAAGKKTSLDLPGASIASADAAPPGISLDVSARSTSGDVAGASPDISGRRSVISSDLKQIIHPDANQGEKEGEN